MLKIIRARRSTPVSIPGLPQQPDVIEVTVHLDTTKVLADGSPDPAWTIQRLLHAADPSGVQTDAAAWRAAQVTNLQRAARNELARLQALATGRPEAAGAVDPLEGQTFA